MELQRIDAITKAEVLLEALPYIQRFKGSTFVVKYGGSFMDDDEQVRARVATDLVFLSAVGINVVLVHGGGKRISQAMKEQGHEAVFRHGLRVTDEPTMAIVEHCLDETINHELCDLVAAKGGRPYGIRGSDVLRCEKLLAEENGETIDLGYVGRITSADSERIRRALAMGFLPIVSPTARGTDNHAYNTNADTAASFVASTLMARRLVYLCDVPGLLRDKDDHGSLISTLHIDEVEPLKEQGVIAKGMQPKVDSAVFALHNGVNRVHFVDGRRPHSLLLEIFTHAGIGTEIVRRRI